MSEFSVSVMEMRLAISKVGPTAIEKVAIDLAFATHELMQATEAHPAYPFAEAMRYAMNDMKLAFERRKVYRAVLGSYFGSHGGRVAAKNRKMGKKKAQPNKPKRFRGSHEVLIEPDGQLAFRM